MKTKRVFFGKSVLLAIVVIALVFGSCPEEPDNNNNNNNGNGTGTHDIDSSLYGTWRNSNNTLTVTFSSNGITWGGTVGTGFNIQGVTWTAKNGTISFKSEGKTTNFYDYTISSGNLILTQIPTGSQHTLTKDGGSSGGGGGTWTPDDYSPIQLTENQWANGNISTSSGQQWFTFTATASTQYIHVAFGTLTNLYVQIYDSNGNTVGSSTNIYDFTRYVSRSLTSWQTYYIKVWPYGSNSGSYQITFNTSSTPPVADGGDTSRDNAIQLTENQWADANISTSGEEQWFTFTATASTQYIHVAFGTLTNLYVQIYDNNGDTVGSSTNIYDSIRYVSRSLTSWQTYYIKVWPYGSNNGAYQIAFNTSSTPPVAVGGNGTWAPDGYSPIQLTENQWTSGNISMSGGQQWFIFTATASTQYIHVSFGTLNDLNVQIYDSNGSTVGSSSNLYSSTRYASRSLTSGQTYYIKVWPYSGSGNGSYQIAFNTSSAAPTGGNSSWTPGYSTSQLTENEWTNGNIVTSSGQQWFTFTATESMQYIHVSFSTLSDLYVQIYDSNGSTVGSSSNLYSSTRSTSRSLTSGQTYYIKVWPNSGSGTYQIAFNTSSTPPISNSTVTSVTVSPSLLSVDKGGTRQFSATVYGTNNPPQTVTWAVADNTKSATFISSSGLLSIAVDETATTLTVTATSTFDISKSGTATVSVTVPDSELYIGNSTLPVDLSSYTFTGSEIYTENTTFAKALNYIRFNAANNTTYTIIVNGNIRQSQIYLDAIRVNNRTGVTIILKGRDSERTINLERYVILITGVEFILEENITLKAYTIPNNRYLVGVGSSAIFRMREGSKITENYIFDTTSSSNNGAIYIDSGGTFYMEGGEISDNRVNRIDNTFIMAAGAVYVSGSFYMSGGVIKNNFAAGYGGIAGGVLITGNNGYFEKTGGVIYGGSAGSGLENTGREYSNNSYYAHAVFLQRNGGLRQVNRTLWESDNLSTSNINTGWTD